MQPTERVEVRKIYPGSTALVGVYFGVIIGLISAVFVLISGLVIAGGIDLLFFQIDTLPELIQAAGIVFLFQFVSIFIMVFLGGLIYNLVSRMGGRFNFGLAEYDIVQKKPKPASPQLSPQEARRRYIIAQEKAKAELREAAKKNPEIRSARDSVRRMSLN